MSIASAIPPRVAGQQRRLDHRPGQQELEEAVDRGEAGEVHRPTGARALDGQQQRRDDSSGATSWGRRSVWRTERLPSGQRSPRAFSRRLRRGFERPYLIHLIGGARTSGSAPSRCWPVFSTKTSSRVGRRRSSEATCDPGLVERPDHGGDCRGAVGDLDQHACRPSAGAASRTGRRTPVLGLGARPVEQAQADAGLADLAP